MMTKLRICYIVSGIISIFFILFTIGLVLSQTLFKPKHPILQSVSSTVEGISTDVFAPTGVQLNISLSLEIVMKNPNLADFEFQKVQNSVYFRNMLVGNLTLPASTLPAKGSVMVSCPLVLQIDKFVADLGDIIQDILLGKIVMETKANMPGKVTFLGIFKMHLKTISHCNLLLAFPSMEVTEQVCDLKTKL